MTGNEALSERDNVCACIYIYIHMYAVTCRKNLVAFGQNDEAVTPPLRDVYIIIIIIVIIISITPPLLHYVVYVIVYRGTTTYISHSRHDLSPPSLPRSPYARRTGVSIYIASRRTLLSRHLSKMVFASTIPALVHPPPPPPR